MSVLGIVIAVALPAPNRSAVGNQVRIERSVALVGADFDLLVGEEERRLIADVRVRSMEDLKIGNIADSGIVTFYGTISIFLSNTPRMTQITFLFPHLFIRRHNVC